VEGVNGVDEIRPVVYKAGIVKHSDNIYGVLFKGVEQHDTLSLGVSIPKRLAELSGLAPGDKMLTYFVGESVKARQFNVVSVYNALIETDDKLVVYADIADLQRVNGWEDGFVSCLEVMLDDDLRNEEDIEYINGEIGTLINAYSADDEEYVIATSSVSSYPQLFDWLDLIDFNVLFILILMTIVAGVNMISGLLIMLFENISTIGILKALGMTDKSISKVFLSSAAVLVLKGMLVGNALALIFCFVQDKTHLLKLDPTNYFVSFVPVKTDVGAVLLADIGSFIVIMLFMLIPTLFISKVDPAQTVRMK
jgi:lipoprotein-releasing system permease protein